MKLDEKHQDEKENLAENMFRDLNRIVNNHNIEGFISFCFFNDIKTGVLSHISIKKNINSQDLNIPLIKHLKDIYNVAFNHDLKIILNLLSPLKDTLQNLDSFEQVETYIESNKNLIRLLNTPDIEEAKETVIDEKFIPLVSKYNYESTFLEAFRIRIAFKNYIINYVFNSSYKGEYIFKLNNCFISYYHKKINNIEISSNHKLQCIIYFIILTCILELKKAPNHVNNYYDTFNSIYNIYDYCLVDIGKTQNFKKDIITGLEFLEKEQILIKNKEDEKDSAILQS